MLAGQASHETCIVNMQKYSQHLYIYIYIERVNIYSVKRLQIKHINLVRRLHKDSTKVLILMCFYHLYIGFMNLLEVLNDFQGF